MLLDKISEALEYLNPEHIKDLSFYPQYEDEKSQESMIKTNPPPSKYLIVLKNSKIVKLLKNLIFFRMVPRYSRQCSRSDAI